MTTILLDQMTISKGRTKDKNEICKKYFKSGRWSSNYENQQTIGTSLTVPISSSRNFYHECLENKLNDPTTLSKTYRSVFKTLVNCKKIPVIPQILVNNELVTNSTGKVNIIRISSSKQCQTISNESILLSIRHLKPSTD